MDENVSQPPTPPQEYVAPQEEQPRFPIKKMASLTAGIVALLVFILIFFVFIAPRLFVNKSKDITLTYWVAFEDTAPFKAIAGEYTRLNPHIKVNIEKQDIKALGKYYDRLLTRIQKGTGPDMFRFHNAWIREVRPLLLALPEDVVKGVLLDSKFYPVVSRDLKINGAYYGVPIHFDTLALFINTEIFQNAGVTSYPQTWDDLTSVARQLTVSDENGRIVTSGIALGTYDNIAHASDIVSLLLIQNGADLLGLSGASSQSAYDALDFYTSFARGDTKVWDETLENSKLAFARGKLAMYLGFSWDIFELKAVNPNLAFTVVPVPHLPSRNSTIASYWVEGVSSKTRNPREAFDFIKFVGKRENMEKMYTQEAKVRLFGELYPRSDMAYLLKNNALIYPFVQQGPNAYSTIFSGDTYDDAMVDSLNKYLGDAIRSILNDNSSPQSAVETLSAGVSQVLNRYQNEGK